MIQRWENRYKSEDAAFMEGFTTTTETTFFNGDASTNSAEFTGLANRFNSIKQDAAPFVWDNKAILGGGQSGNEFTSIYIVSWHPRGTYMFWPSNARDTGLSIMPLPGIQIDVPPGITTANSNLRFPHLTTYFRWALGLKVADLRWTARLANIHVDPATGVHQSMQKGLMRLIGSLPGGGFLPGAKTVLYMRQNTWIALQEEATLPTNAGMAIRPMEFFGEKVQSIQDVAIRRVGNAAILDTEAEVN